MKYRWIFREFSDESTVQHLASSLHIPRGLAQVLAARGLDSDISANRFLVPTFAELHDPFLMDGMELAVERIERAISAGELIWIHGDYDVDGTSSTALTLQFLREIGARVEYFIPDRQGDGYGLSHTSINQARIAGATLIITVDCGVTSVESIHLAKEYGIDTIVCDHHEPGETLPEAVAILDPLKPGCTYPFKYLAACGVCFKLAQALSIRRGQPQLAFKYLDFVALASTADIVPLIGENRALVYFGLQVLNESPRAGFRGLLECADMQPGNLTTSSIVYGLAPRINAAGRVGDARRAVEMMTQNDEGAAFAIAQQLEQDNRKRRTFDEYTFAEAKQEADRLLKEKKRHSLVLHKPTWHAGVIGIVASRLVEKYHLPTVMLTTIDSHAKGSARSIKGFDIHSALKSCEEYLLEFGGHKHAAGLTLEEANISALREAFDAYASTHMSEEMLVPELLIDAEMRLNELSPGFFDVIKKFAPFGHQNPKPIFYSRSVVSANGVKVVGNNHLKFRALQSNFIIDAIGFNLGDKISLCTGGKPFTIAYTLEENTYNGTTTPQISIKDVRADA
ncbi:MAG: single-stranded-DNA-specific exonuclease RecJ [Candidatus Kapaibacterium sp.]